jgi:hypothetical protein
MIEQLRMWQDIRVQVAGVCRFLCRAKYANSCAAQQERYQQGREQD